MTARAYLLAGFLFILLAMSSWVHAETIPATASTDTAPSTSSYFGQKILHCSNWPSGTYFLTADAAKSYIESLCTGVTPGNPRQWTGNTFQVLDFDGVTWRNVYNLVSTTGACPTGYAKNASNYCEKTTYTCPATGGWTLSGQSCTRTDCAVGTVRNETTGACGPQECTHSSGVRVVGGIFWGSTIEKTACYEGCQTNYTGSGKTLNHLGSDFYLGDYISTGKSYYATPEPEPAAPAAEAPSDPPTTAAYDCVKKGMSYGEVNGTTVCVPAGTPDTPPFINQPEKSETTAPDGTKTETQHEDTVSGGQVTRTTTTTVTDAQGNVVSQGTTSTTATQGAFCEQNPNSPVCKDSKVTGGGNCQTPPVPAGDAIQSAILRQTWETRCQAEKTADALGSDSELAQQLAGVGETAMTGDPTELSEFTDEIDVSNQISTAKFLSGSGLQDKIVALPMGKTLVIPFSQLNQYLQIFGNLMVIIAMLAAGRIVGVF
jgi:hypothetical protein